MKSIRKSKEWKKLETLAKKISKKHIHDMFKEDKDRYKKYTIQLDNLIFDFSKNRIDEDAFAKLIALAKSVNIQEKIEEMFCGEKINTTENRAVLHTALRNRDNYPIYVDDEDVMPKVNEVLAKMKKFSEAVRLGNWKGNTGKRIKSVVNIGIGGSDLGPVMAVEALKPYCQDNLDMHFVSNIDGTHMIETLKKCKPESTLFIVASKTFTTQETLTNAKTARKWLVDDLGEPAVAKHFVALSTNSEEVSKFGIDVENMFEFWNWVGGRYSMWSAIGLPIMIAIGPDNFEKMLDGAYAIDKHFRTTALEDNIPVIMALLGVWYNNFFGAESYAVLPYDQYLHRFPAYLQQADMESNGKGVRFDGKKLDYMSGPVLFGEPGTNGQHSFYQLIHQGTHLIPCDFIAPMISHNETGNHHEILLANVLAQSKALMRGKTEEEAEAELVKAGKTKEEIKLLKKHRAFEGNRPSNMILVKKIDPFTLGSLVALYEHKIFVQGAIWQVNSYDQWGVELGKQLANNILPQIADGKKVTTADNSTNNLIKQIRKVRK